MAKEMEELKVIQIAVAGHTENVATQSEFSLIALCADGSLWICTNRDIRGKQQWDAVKGPTREKSDVHF